MAAREISCAEIAKRLGLTGSKKVKLQRARRVLKRLGIARQHGQRGRVFTTLSDLKYAASHLWADVVANSDSEG